MSGASSPASLFAHTQEERPHRPLPWWAWLVSGAGIFTLATAGVLFTPPGSPVAVWWPAAGVSVLFSLLASPSRPLAAVVFVFGITTAANAVAGRPLVVSAAFGVANAGEVATVLWVTGSFRRRLRLRALNDGVRFAAAVGAGAVVAGLIAGITVAAEGGEFLRTTIFVTASHAAAVLMIAPVGLLPRPIPRRRSPVEVSLQIVVLTAVIAAVFAPGATLPLAFLPYPVLAWAAFRFPIRLVVFQQLIASLTILVLTLIGGGPFAASSLDILTAAALVEIFLVTFAGFAIVLASAQYELRETTRRLDASARLLSGGIIDAQVGLVTVRPHGDRLTVLWRNTAALELLADELTDRSIWRGTIADSAQEALNAGGAQTVTVGARTLTVSANPVSDEDDTFAVQLSDITSIIGAQQARLDAERARADALRAQIDLERQREDFVATTSHELRTPVTAILGYLELIEDAPVIDTPQREWLGIIDRNARRLLGLIEDLLTFGQARENSAAPRHTIPLDATIHDALSSLAPILDGKKINITLDLHGATVRCDPRDALRAINNLLSNAAKFTPNGGSIRIRSEQGDSGTLLHIEDTGPGMDDHSLNHAFDRFFRAPEAERTNVPGTGLGLSIVRELMQRNGGNIVLQRGIDGGLQATLAFQ